MRHLVRTVMTFALVMWGGAAYADKSYVRDDLASDSVHLEDQLRKDAGSLLGSKAPVDLVRQAAQLVQKNDPKDALQPLAAAITESPKDPFVWLLYARTADVASQNNNNDVYTLQTNAIAAAYTSYQRATTTGDEATALAFLGQVYAEHQMWRLSLNAYKASLDRVNAPDVLKTYTDLRAQYGFRILDYKVDSDSASPRVCFQFSDPLAPGKVDFAPYVAVSGATNSAITTEDEQLCVEGLQHGQRYSIVVRQGLPSSVGEALLKDNDYEIYVKDRSPQVHFTGKNYVLPRVGQEGIPVVSVNTPQVAIDVLRIGDRSVLPTIRSDDFLSQIDTDKVHSLIDDDGVKVWSGTLDVTPTLNEDVVTAFPIMQAVPKLSPGVYVMVARAGDKPASAVTDSDSDDSSNLTATQWFVVSDLGLTVFTGNDGVHVLVRSLATAAPLSGVTVKLVARNNDVLATKTTGVDGNIQFDPGLSRGTGGLRPGLIVATDANADYDFLDLTDAPFDLSDRGVSGRAAPGALDAFVYTERGVYRSGETVNLTALLRDNKGASVVGLPLTITTMRPDGVVYKSALVSDQGLGGRAFSVALLSGVPTGTWRVNVYSDPKSPPIGTASFLVEDYVPETLDFTLKPQQKVLHSGEAANIDTETRFLYGAPGAGLDISGDVTVEAVDNDELPTLPGFSVGLTDQSVDPVKNDIETGATTDDKGLATIAAPVPDTDAPRPLEAKITLRAAEPGGRAVERSVTLPILPKSSVIGVKKDFGDLSEGGTATFDIVAAGPDGTRVAQKGLLWSLYQVNDDYQWYNSDGTWGFERVKSSKRIANGAVDVTAQDAGKIAQAVDFGTYRLDLASADGSDQPTSITFEVGWGGDASADTPDLLQVTLDKTNYVPGDPMKLDITSRFDGKADVAIVGDKVDDFISLDVKTGANEVTIPVGSDWGAGAYAVAIAHRPLDVAAKRMPGRALGLTWFSIDSAAHKLDVALAAPAQIVPRTTLTLPIKIAGLAPGEEADVTVAAVDVGILNLTHYELPNPSDYFFGQRQLSSDIRDLYGLLIDGMQGAVGGIRTGGDAGGELPGAKPTQEPLSRYSGVVKVGADGTAQVSFDIPAFEGTVRVMAVAWSKDRVGSASADVVVRDPVVVQATLPRFLALGDRSTFNLQVNNVDGPAGAYKIDLDVNGPVTVAAQSLRSSFTLAADGRTAINIPITGAGVGTAGIGLTLTGPGIVASQNFTLSVEPGTSDLYRRTVQQIAPGGSVTLSSDLVADYIPGTGAVAASVSPAGIDVPALLQALDRYPYGCSEQVVSRAMPLLYVNKLAAAAALAPDTDIDARIKDSIDRELARQDTNGAFGLWTAGSDDDLWLDGYVMDFLTRARENGYMVPQQAFEQGLDHLRNQLVNTDDIADGAGEPIAYAAYVLARNGRPVMGDLRYLADTKLASFKSPLARAQLAAALALLGDRGRAQTVFSSAVDDLEATKPSPYSRPDYGSRLRDSAGLLALAAESGFDNANIQKASLTLNQEQAADPYTSTQENAWLVLAAEALSKNTAAVALTVDGTAQKGSFFQRWGADQLTNHSVTIANTGTATAQFVVTTSGNPIVPEGAQSQGYKIDRAYYTMDGNKADLDSIKQNDRLVVVLTATESEKAYAKLILVDRLPAGLEIDNPALVDSGSVSALTWLKQDVDASHTEYRDDRFVATFDRDGSEAATFTVAYIVRAVTPGHYVLPPVTIEDMYAPARFGRGAFGSIDVSSAH